MIILYDNKVDSSTITVSSEQTYFKRSNLYNIHLSKWFKTSGMSDEWIMFAGSISASSLSLVNHNLTSSAVVHIMGNDSDEWTSPTTDITLTWADYIISQRWTQITHSFWRVSFSDITNPDGCIRLGYVFLGNYLTTPGMAIDQEIVDTTTTRYDYSSSLQLYSDIGQSYKEFTINYPFISTAKRDEIKVMWDLVGNYKPVIVLIWENNLTLQPPIFCHIVENLKWGRNDNNSLIWNLSLSFQEVF